MLFCTFWLLSIALHSTVQAKTFRPVVIELSNPVMAFLNSAGRSKLGAAMSKLASHFKTSAVRVGLFRRAAESALIAQNIDEAFMFHGEIQVGSPAKSLFTHFDTGSTRLWISSKNCTPGYAIRTQKSYIPSQSSSFVDLNETAPPISYADGTSAQGNWILDSVSVNGAKLDHYKLQLATTAETRFIEDGIFGLAFSMYENAPTFWETYIKTNPEAPPLFSYFIQESDAAGVLALGGINKRRLKSPVVWTNVLPTYPNLNKYVFWKIKIDRVSVGSHPMALDGMSFKPIVDTGSSYSYFPASIATQIHETLGLYQKMKTKKGYSVLGMPCPNKVVPSTLLSLSLVLANGATLSMAAQDYLFVALNDQNQWTCFSGILHSPGNRIVLGNTLIRAFYTIFDVANKRVGFAIANRRATVGPAQWVNTA